MPVDRVRHRRLEGNDLQEATEVHRNVTVGAFLRSSGCHSMVTVDTQALRDATLAFVKNHHVAGGAVGEYHYAATSTAVTLYSSCYAVKTRWLYNDLHQLGEAEKNEWVHYLGRHQDEDGLFRDPVIFGQGWYKDDPFWCGRPHLTFHVVTALTCLGATAQRSFALVDEYSEPDTLVRWLEERDWGERVGWTGNEIFNMGFFLQYSRDFHHDERAGRAVEVLLDWLDAHWINPDTGVWGRLDLSDPIARSHAVQAAYHWWPLYFYDRREIPFVRRAIDTVLETQNPNGGFGWGVHNPDDPYAGSACEDIDSIDPLARMYFVTEYRRNDIRHCLSRALPAVLRNRTDDGGFAFLRGKPFEYGHPQLSSDANTGAMFPTWFRTLSLALIAQVLTDSEMDRREWRFIDCPGNQFWRCP